MFNFLNQYSKIILFIFSLGILSFIFIDLFNPSNQNTKSNQKLKFIAKINNYEISFSDYIKELKIVNQNFLNESDKLKSEKEISKLVYQRLINKNLIYLYGIDNNINISNEELMENIKKYEIFQINNKFNKNKYLDYFVKNELKFKDFEENVRKDLIINKTLSLYSLKSLNDLKQIYYGDIVSDIHYSEINFSSLNINLNKIEEKKLFLYWFNNRDLFKTKELYNYELSKLTNTKENYELMLKKFNNFKFNYLI